MYKLTLSDSYRGNAISAEVKFCKPAEESGNNASYFLGSLFGCVYLLFANICSVMFSCVC